MKKTRKVTAIVLAMLMVLAVIPVTAFAHTPEVKPGTTYTAVIPEDGCAEYLFKPEESSKYAVISDNGNDDLCDPYISVYGSDGNFIIESDDNDFDDTYNFYCIFYAEAGEEYYLCLEEYDYNACEYDFYIKKIATINHQPTTDEPYVALNEECEVEYQWYRITDKYEITDENATAREGDVGVYATYDSDTGWTGATVTDSTSVNFFEVDLEAGQFIEVAFDCMADDFDIDCICGDDSTDWDDVPATEKIIHQAECTDTYEVDGNFDDEVHLRVYVYDIELVEDETDAQLTADELGEYFCVVTYEDGREEVSDSFIACDHMCHKGGFMGFIWSIINFFLGLFGAEPICECGAFHY